MFLTTIIELNHDQVDEIEQDKEAFVEQILKQMHSVQDFQQDIKGGKIIGMVRNDFKDKKYKAWYNLKRYFRLNVPVCRKRNSE